MGLFLNMGFQTKPIVIDARGHLLGRLAAIVAKTILQGQRVVIVRCEGMNISGNFYRNRLKYLEFLRKRMNTNPKRGPFHFRAPSKIFWRTVRGMLPHKLTRGKEALDRLKAFEGILPPTTRRRGLWCPLPSKSSASSKGGSTVPWAACPMRWAGSTRTWWPPLKPRGRSSPRPSMRRKGPKINCENRPRKMSLQRLPHTRKSSKVMDTDEGPVITYRCQLIKWVPKK